MTIAVAGFTRESNTFAPEPTRLADFGARKGGGIPVGEAVFERVEAQSSFQGFCAAARAAGCRLHPVLHAYAPPGGAIEREAFESLADRILTGIAAAPGLRGVFLELHGAMVAQGFPAGDLELVERVRRLVGLQVPIVVALDSHGNVGAELVSALDGISAYRTYPHVDMPATGARAFALLAPLLEGDPPWERAFADVPYLMPLSRQSTLHEPVRGLYAELARLEAQAAEPLSLSLMTGFPLADVPQCRPSIFGYGRSAGAVRDAVARLQRSVLEAENQFEVRIPDVDQAVVRALAAPRGPVVLADVQDNAGGGASSDTVWILEALMRHQAPDAIVGMVYDPECAQAAHAAGVGARLHLSLGGKRMPGHRPLTAAFDVVAVRSEPVTLRGPMMAGTQMDLGPMAVLRTGGIQVIVNSRRAQCLDREYFRVFGLEPEAHAVVVVKSTNHYRADFEAIAAEIIEFAAPGACAMDPAQLQFHHLAAGTRVRPSVNP